MLPPSIRKQLQPTTSKSTKLLEKTNKEKHNTYKTLISNGIQLSELVVPKASYCIAYMYRHNNGKHVYIAKPRWSMFNNLQKATHIGFLSMTCNNEHSNKI
jgi:hypothetical protein